MRFFSVEKDHRLKLVANKGESISPLRWEMKMFVAISRKCGFLLAVISKRPQVKTCG